MKKSLKKLVLIGMSGMMFSAVIPTVYAQESSDESTTEETTSETTDEATEESELQAYLNEAAEMFLSEYPDAELEEIDIELRNDEYKITIHGFDGSNEYEVDFSVNPVEITDREEDNDDDDNDDNDEALILEDLISLDEASEIALEEAGGGTITDWNLDYDDGRFRWDIEIDDLAVGNSDDDDDDEFNIEIDATTGEIIEVDFD